MLNSIMKIKANTTAESPKVVLDGEDTGKTAPAEFQVGGGQHRVLLKKDGYLMYKRKAQEVWVSEDTEVEVPLYRDATGTWRQKSKPSRKYDVKTHFNPPQGENCKSDVFLKNLSSRGASYCLLSNDLIKSCSRENPCQGFWVKGEILNSSKISLTTCNTNSGCFQPKIFKKISN